MLGGNPGEGCEEVGDTGWASEETLRKRSCFLTAPQLLPGWEGGVAAPLLLRAAAGDGAAAGNGAAAQAWPREGWEREGRNGPGSEGTLAKARDGAARASSLLGPASFARPVPGGWVQKSAPRGILGEDVERRVWEQEAAGLPLPGKGR